MDVPFIRLFHTPNSAYFLDVNQNEFVQISESSFRYLTAVLQGNSELAMPEELTELKTYGYLSSESAVKTVRHAYSDFIGLFLERKLSKITLQLTQNCNFRCKYCIYSEEHSVRQRSHSTMRMSWETVKKSIDFLWEHSVDSQSVNVGFYGGEPLLEFPLIKRAVEYCESRFAGKKLTFNITTNGTLISDETILFFQEHDLSLMISLDGPKEVNDKNRVFADGRGTFDAVLERIRRIQEIAPEYAEKLQISMVVDPGNDFDCINEVYLDGDELSKLSVQPSMLDRDYDDEETEYSEEYSWKYEYHRFLSILSRFGRFPKGDVSPIADRSMASAIKDYSKIENTAGLHTVDAPSGPCIPGQMRLFVDVSEQLFPCERVSETSPSMCIGTLGGGFDLEKAYRILNVGNLTEAACRNCWCFRYCTLCAKKSDDGSENLSAKTKLSCCESVQASVFEKLKQHLLLREMPLYYAKQVGGVVE